MSKKKLPKALDAEVGLFGGMGLQQCKRIKKNGDRCKNAPMKGQTVCHKHGGKAPQNLRKAQERIAAAAPGAAARVEWLSQFAKSEYVQLQANQDILNRAGIGDQSDLGIWTEQQPWEVIMANSVTNVEIDFDLDDDDVIEGEVVEEPRPLPERPPHHRATPFDPPSHDQPDRTGP
ncbi:hypothetical protein [Aeromicrobium alkaliterrae]|uniref:Uncharacterized protein n=1 Tax=Aeromicrobium alkaliterrae TaxID=302168 RepID=A0ABP4VTS2_9ACTN